MKSVVFFDLGNLFAECRLSDVQSVGSTREVQLLGQDIDCVQGVLSAELRDLS